MQHKCILIDFDKHRVRVSPREDFFSEMLRWLLKRISSTCQLVDKRNNVRAVFAVSVRVGDYSRVRSYHRTPTVA
uniref:Uncharacterized protein n=1 Tax=Parascaris equorum TaxID=6256 RepID=A0A914RVD6_PAREQ